MVLVRVLLGLGAVFVVLVMDLRRPSIIAEISLDSAMRDLDFWDSRLLSLAAM